MSPYTAGICKIRHNKCFVHGLSSYKRNSWTLRVRTDKPADIFFEERRGGTFSRLKQKYGNDHI